MARLWSVPYHLGWSGQAPMFLFQILLYWAGLGTLALTLALSGARKAAVAILALGLWPPLLGWQVVVVKDGQMAGALLAATALVAWHRLQAKPLNPLAATVTVLLLGYATLVRSNAVFATAPLAVGLLRPWAWREWPSRMLLIGTATVAVLATGPTVNHQLLRAQASGVEGTQPLFDLAGIAHRAGPDAVPLIGRDTWRRLEAERCDSSILWDKFSGGQRCDFLQRDFDGKPRAAIFAAWIVAIREHPGAYLSHRAAHWNATMRWLVPWHLPQAIPQAQSLPNTFGLRSPGLQVVAFDRLAGWLANSPLGAPILAFAAALAVLALARPGESTVHALAVPLALSAVAMECSFFFVSISGDLRYHLWSILAGWLSGILLLTRPLPRRGARVAIACLALVAATSLAARVVLPQVGDDYEALLR